MRLYFSYGKRDSRKKDIGEKKKIKNRKIRIAINVSGSFSNTEQMFATSTAVCWEKNPPLSFAGTLFAWIIKYFIRRLPNRSDEDYRAHDRPSVSVTRQVPREAREKEKDKFNGSCPKPVSRVGRWILKFTDRHGEPMGEMTTWKSDRAWSRNG